MVKPQSWSTPWAGRTLTIETGHFALNTYGSCTVRYGDTVVMATVMKSDNIRDGIDYFPLMVDFEEKLYAAGKIKGSRFIKREGRPSDDAILTARLIDRAIRPLFDPTVRNDVQVIVTALSVDGENHSAVVGLIAASTALSISSVPWAGPIGAARVGLASNGEFILNVLESQIKNNESNLDLTVAGTPEKLVMVEAGASEIKDEVVMKAMKWGCEQLQPIIDLITKVQTEVGKSKVGAMPVVIVDETSKDAQILRAKDLAKKFIAQSASEFIFNSPKVSKADRTAMIDLLKEKLKAHLAESGIETDFMSGALKNVKEYISAIISEKILQSSERLDGRSLTGIRELTCETDLLPRVHGSAMFMRGDTQVLSVVTLGAPGDVQTLDGMEEAGTKRYMHHYNDAPYSYGEVAPLRGPGRRAIGHGALAERALLPVLPDPIDFPYTIRVVSEVLGSNGSSSMASTCGSSLSLMAAGVPIKKPVAGIAMGLASDEKGNFKVITDLQDVEDGLGGMDFKIAGTVDGITAIQMDTKTLGLSWPLVEQTIKQASTARAEILAVMQKTIATPRAELSPFAPRIETIQINPEKIGELIGPGGKTIKKITETTGVSIDIEQDGRVLITSVDATAMQAAIDMVRDLTREVVAGEIYEGKVVRLEDFGVFVQLLPNKDGLVHVSEIAWSHTSSPRDVLKLGDTVKVVVREIDNLGRVNLSIRQLLPKPEGYVDQPPRPMGPRPGGSRPGGFRRP